MITAAFFQRHVHACGGDREVALLDVAEEYVLEYLRRVGLFDSTLVFKGGTALRKYLFGGSGRFSVDMDFALRSADAGDVDMVLDLLDGAELYGVRIALERRKGPAAQLRLTTPLGPVTEPSAISIRHHSPWLPVKTMPPQAFEFLDRGLAPEFTRAALPIPDPREMAAEKIAAFWRRANARDLYDLEHLSRFMQSTFDGPAIAALAALKIYFDVVDEGLGHPPESLSDIFGGAPSDVRGADDLGRLHTASLDIAQTLAQCTTRYKALATLGGEAARLATTCNARDRWAAQHARDELVARLASA
jgi:predicted nucleotidyltransferase component of viral defense system